MLYAADRGPDLATGQTYASPKGHLPSLDGLRAISFMIVFISHLGFMDSRPGGFGVSVFFVVSGYLITTLIIREYQKYGNVSLARFYGRRTARIFPGMYITLLLCGILTKFHFVDNRLHSYFWPLTLESLYLSNYSSWYGVLKGTTYTLSGTSQFWSLCVEEHFYLLFPALFCILLRRDFPFRKIFWILSGVCMVFLAWRLIAVRIIPYGENWCYMTSDSRMDSILWGCGLACLEQVPEWTSLLNKRLLERFLVPVGFLILAATFVFHDMGRMTLRFTAQSIALLPIIYYAVHFPMSAAIRPLNSRILVHIGTLSYSLYLLHNVIILLCRRYEHSGVVVLWVSSALFSWLAALMMHWGVERPFEALRAKLRRPVDVQGDVGVASQELPGRIEQSHLVAK